MNGKMDKLIQMFHNFEGRQNKQFLVLRQAIDHINIRLYTLEGQMVTLYQRLGILLAAPQVDNVTSEDVVNMAQEAAAEEAEENAEPHSPSHPTVGPLNTDNV